MATMNETATAATTAPAPLTAESIQAMPAGREMDGTIAARFFGWRWWRWQPYTYWRDDDKQLVVEVKGSPHRFFAPSEPDWHDAPGMEPKPWDGVEELAIQPPGTYDPLPPAFSSSIESAWQVVEHIGRDWLVGIGGPDGSGEWHAGLCKVDGACDRVVGSDASTAPLAVCRAALLATLEGQP